MLKLGIKIDRKRLEKRLLDEWEKNPARFYKALDKALEEAASKKAGLEQTRLVTRRVCREMYQADPAGFIWTIRKGLSPGFNVGEDIVYGKRGALRKGVIRTIGNFGAVVASLENPGIGYPIPGAYIHKLEKTANVKKH
jgi:hypothetical protein